MSRKDYILLAKAIRIGLAGARHEFNGQGGRETPESIRNAEEAVAFTAERVAKACHRANPRFDFQTFYKACGLRPVIDFGSGPGARVIR